MNSALLTGESWDSRVAAAAELRTGCSPRRRLPEQKQSVKTRLENT